MVEKIHLAQIASLGQYSGGLASILEVLFAINALLYSAIFCYILLYYTIFCYILLYSGGLASILEVLFAINALLSSVTALSDFIRIRIPLGQKPKS